MFVIGRNKITQRNNEALANLGTVDRRADLKFNLERETNSKYGLRLT
ncbi:hypothetical protein ACOMICROBIO_GDFFDHBD_02696 [Vibrio sp. B1REV9]|nr:hypothetical protein ACOMICROBIO_GDFFDHBD_02696 [Vibrio sp. B1REV9]